MTSGDNHLRRRGESVFWGALAILTLSVFGCTTLNDPNVPNPIGSHVEPHDNSKYLLYRPSAYDRRDAWPLLIVCHGRFPDSPLKQIRLWTQLAERYGFIVAAPTMPAAPGGWTTDESEQADAVERARQRILSVVKHVRGSHTISRDRIFIHGHGSGTEGALQTGLTQSDLFRAVSIDDPKVDGALLDQMKPSIDRYQSVLVMKHAAGVLSGKQAERCIDWLREHNFTVQIESATSDRIADAERIIEFFETLIRTRPWLRIETARTDDGNPLGVRFSLVGTYEPQSFRWEFGDGDSSTVAAPIHRFQQAGRYRVIVTVDGPHGTELSRFADVSVPLSPIEAIGTVP